MEDTSLIVIDGEEYATVEHLARIIERNPETIRRRIKAGKLPARKVDDTYISKTDFLAHFAPQWPGKPEQVKTEA